MSEDGLYKLHLFEGYGIELEYMIVSKADFKALPVTDKVLFNLAGQDALEVEMNDDVAWSNELAKHVIEIKSNGPKKNLMGLQGLMQDAIRDMNKELESEDAYLVPSAMHPFYNPDEELKLWTNENSEIYAAYDRIFGCKGHGWANLQSVHINMPFYNDDEFRNLHAAIRLVVPVLPTIAASSPIVQGQRGPFLDSRLHYYLQNQRRIGSIIGHAIPEAAVSEADYNAKILQPMYRDIAPHDPLKVLQEEWLNSRTAIARFERNAIEIRILDIQECLRGDFAIIAFVIATVRALAQGHWRTVDEQNAVSTESMRGILDGILAKDRAYVIEDQAYLQNFGLSKSTSVQDFIQHLVDSLPKECREFFSPFHSDFNVLLTEGNLSTRILRAVGDDFSRENLESVYRRLPECLAYNQFFGRS